MRADPKQSPISDQDLYLFNEGSHFRLYEKLGSHPAPGGTWFAVWAPNAEYVSVIGDHNGWNGQSDPLHPRGSSGIWEGFIPDIGPGAVYKYEIRSRERGYRVEKADPFAFRTETPPKTASIVWDLSYIWEDADWMRNRHRRNSAQAPISIYEVHNGSWRRVLEDGNRSLNYWELSGPLSEYAEKLGFSHVEFLPIMEHPFFGSWGYQATGFFAPTSRYGTPQDFMHLVDHLHQRGIGVILDWVPSHFPTDEHGLGYFDGTHLYEHADPRRGFHPDWNSYIFNYGRHEVRSFLISSALFWLDRYHVDGLRVDAVASMLYLDYSRKAGEWIPNDYGGRENIEAIDFLRRFNDVVHENHQGALTSAEESTAWPGVTHPTSEGGLGFDLKWNMGWMHDTLEYVRLDPLYRKFHQNQLTFSFSYAFSERYILPLSHDEVIHLKHALVNKMPGDIWRRMASLRSLYAVMYAHPGKK
ncbi:MAG TPA: 1,4-alpha-glucan branching protein GlgB, partial [Chloroflexota bacterium]